MRELLRKAGTAIRNFDDAYADKVRTGMADKPGGVLAGIVGGMPITHGVAPSPTEELAMSFAKSNNGPASKGQIQRHQAIEMGVGGAVLAANAGVRYGLPAAGVTLAGKGLYDLTTQFGNEADYPESNQLTLR